MTVYNTVEIAKLLEINSETVRRWIRSGELKASRSANKYGSLIVEDDLRKFVMDKPKYKLKLEQKLDPDLSGDLLTYLISERERLDRYIKKLRSSRE